MFQKSENSEPIQPPAMEQTRNGVIIRRNFIFVDAVENEDIPIPAHWEYEEWQMTAEQFEVWLTQQADNDFLTMENEILTEENEQQQADIDFCLMLLEE